MAAMALVHRVLPGGIILEVSSMFGWLPVGAVVIQVAQSLAL
jgi:hypothetical protein